MYCCVFAAILLRCEGDGNAGVGSGRGVVAVSAHMCGTRDSGVLASAGVVRGVGGVCVWLGAGWGGRCWG